MQSERDLLELWMMKGRHRGWGGVGRLERGHIA
jgi:hypothetical protein